MSTIPSLAQAQQSVRTAMKEAEAAMRDLKQAQARLEDSLQFARVSHKLAANKKK